MAHLQHFSIARQHARVARCPKQPTLNIPPDHGVALLVVEDSRLRVWRASMSLDSTYGMSIKYPDIAAIAVPVPLPLVRLTFIPGWSFS